MASALKSPKDFYSGLMFVAFGLAAVVIGRDYPMGTAVRMGSGYFPTILGGLLILLGGIITTRGMLRAGESLGGIALKAMVLVLGAVAFFAGVVNFIGLAASVAGVAIISSLANPKFRPTELTILVVVLIALAVGVFAYGLSLPFKVWPGA